MTSVPFAVRFGWYACSLAVTMVEMQIRVSHAVTMALLSAGKQRAQAVTPAPTPAPVPTLAPVAVVAPLARRASTTTAPEPAEPRAAKRSRSPSLPPPLPAARGLPEERP